MKGSLCTTQFYCVLFSMLFASTMVKSQCYTDYDVNHVPAQVSVWSTCPNKWNLSATATTYSNTVYCGGYFGCYQLDLFKNGTHVAQGFSNNATSGFAFPVTEKATYQLYITTKYILEENSCGGIWLIVTDKSDVVTLHPFCIPSVTLSNVSSAAGTLFNETNSSGYIASANAVTVNTNTTVDWNAQEYVAMNPGFLAESGSDFEAVVGECPYATSSCTQRTEGSTDIITVPDAVVSKENDTKVFPNPSSGSFHIYTGNCQGSIGVVELFDAMGEKILTLETGEIKASYHVNEPGLTGIYLIKISTAQGSTVQKILINK